MRVQVECYAGHKGAERPIRFRLRENSRVVEEILHQWYGLEDTFFKIRADDGNVYILRLTPGVDEDLWTIEAFRSAAR